MNSKVTLNQTMLRTQFILLPAFFGGFLGKDLLNGSVQTSKILAGIVLYGIINLFIYLILKNKFKSN